MISMFVVCSTVLTILFVLNAMLPPVYDMELKAEITPLGVPMDDYFSTPVKDRPELPQPKIRIQNTGDEDWTNILVSINDKYKWSPIPDDGGRIPAGESREFYVCRFQVRTGGAFEWDKLKVKSVHVYARLPSGERATYLKEIQ